MTKTCTHCKAPPVSRRHKLCAVCGTEEARRKRDRVRWARNHKATRKRIMTAMPDGWEEMLLDALHEVLHEHDVTLTQLVGRSRAHQMMTEDECVPTIRNLAPRLRVRGIRLSEVILRAESIWGQA